MIKIWSPLILYIQPSLVLFLLPTTTQTYVRLSTWLLESFIVVSLDGSKYSGTKESWTDIFIFIHILYFILIFVYFSDSDEKIECIHFNYIIFFLSYLLKIIILFKNVSKLKPIDYLFIIPIIFQESCLTPLCLLLSST